MTRALSLVVVTLLLAGSVAAAQALPQEGPPVVAPAAPVLSEIETLRLDNLELQRQLAEALAEADACRAQLGPLRAQTNARLLQDQAAALTRAIEEAHPGYTFDIRTRTWTAKPPSAKKDPGG